MKRRLILIGSAVAAAALAGGIAYAQTTGNGGTLAACAQTQTGQLRLDNGHGCLAGEQPVQLGTAAATRADERFYVAPNLVDRSTFLPLTIGFFPSVIPTATRVVTMHVPAGNYALGAEIVFSNHTGSVAVPCILLDAAGTTHGFAQGSVGIAAGFNRDETLTIDGALSLPAGTDLSLVCWASPVVGFDPGTTLVSAADITTKTVDTATITQETH
jgi:hypothetical protein